MESTLDVAEQTSMIGGVMFTSKHIRGIALPDTSVLATLSGSLPNERLAQLTRDLGRELSLAGIPARPVERPAVPGEKGEAVDLGTIALALVSSGAVTAMIECCKAYLARERALTFKLTRSNGPSVEVNARNVDSVAVREFLEAATRTTAT